MSESYEELLEEISSKSPTPGGGSVAALSGAFGASLVSMVCNLTIGKKKFKDVEKEFGKILIEAHSLKEDLLILSKKDIEAFDEVMDAIKMPKTTSEKEREAALESSYKKAADVPFEVAKKCHKVMELANITAAKGNKNAVTDSGVGALMAHSGLLGAIFNVNVNLKYIKDKDFVAEKEHVIDDLKISGEEIIKTVMKEVARSFEHD